MKDLIFLIGLLVLIGLIVSLHHNGVNGFVLLFTGIALGSGWGFVAAKIDI